MHLHRPSTEELISCCIKMLLSMHDMGDNIITFLFQYLPRINNNNIHVNNNYFFMLRILALKTMPTLSLFMLLLLLKVIAVRVFILFCHHSRFLYAGKLHWVLILFSVHNLSKNHIDFFTLASF